MGSSGYLLLQQSEFVSNYVGSFQELRSAGELFDVTLACEDETVEAHKVVISACSPFFRRVLTKTKQNHPFIYLKGVLHKDLVALLEYIYTGETQVPAEDVNRFIEAAQELKIKGLAEDEKDISDKDNLPGDEKKNHGQPKEEAMEINPKDYVFVSESSILNGSLGSDDGIVDNSIQTVKSSELEQEISIRTGKVKDKSGSAKWKCKDCGKECKNKDKLTAHIQTHLEGFSHSCTICGREYKTRNSLSGHIHQAHKVKREVKEETEDKDGTCSVSDSEVYNFESVDEKEATNLNPVDEDNLRTEILNRMEKVQDTEEGLLWKCTECGKMLKKKDKLELHVETHLEGFTHRCVHCDKIHKTRGALKVHISIYHRGDKSNNGKVNYK